MKNVLCYELQCERLIQGEHFQKTYGLNHRSILNDSRYYHVVGGLPADAMHDVLEGVLHYTIKEVLKVFIIDQQLFSLDELNSEWKSLIMVTITTRIIYYMK